jgi:fimbrial isopeptide formation D2 family protein
MHSFKRRRETFAGGYIDIDKKQGRLTSNGSTAKRTLFFKVVSIAMAIAMIGTTATTVLPALLPKDTAQAATYTFHSPTITVAKPVNFINGDFEKPVIMNGGLAGSYYLIKDKNGNNLERTAPSAATILSDWTTATAGYNWMYVPQSLVPGWNAKPTNSSDNTNPFANVIELQNPGRLGNQRIDMCGAMNQEFYQIVSNCPVGAKVYYSYNAFAHKNYHLVFKCGAQTSTPTIRTDVVSTTGYTTYKGQLTIQNATTYFGFTCPDGTEGYSSPTYNGIKYNNIKTTGEGVYLDNIKFQTGASLIIEKGISNSSGTRIDGGYGEYSDVISIKIKVTNWGETDAAPCVMSDTLWDGLQFVSGTVTNPDGTTTSNISCDTAGKVTAYIGTGATTSAGGTLKGSQSMGTSGTTGKGEQTTVTIRAKITGAPGSTVKNQASVNYKDKGFESYNSASGLTSYSCVDYQMADANNLGVSGKSGSYTMHILNADGSTATSYSNVNLSVQDTYVNRFTIINRESDGTLWYDSNENGKIDSGETKLSGKTVKMQKTTDGGTTWTDAVDWSGTALSTTTNASGYYEFNGILSGKYRVLAQINNTDRVVNKKSSTLPTEVVTTTGTQGSYDNDAQIGTVTDSGKTWAVVQILDKTSQTYTPTAHTYYTHNADIGLVPDLTITKDAKVTSTGNTGEGASISPVPVFYGDTITYTITVKNTGSVSSTSGFSVVDTLPDGLTYISSTLGGTAATPTISGQKLTWTTSSALAANATSIVTVTARVNAPHKNINNIATLTEPDGLSHASNTTYHLSYGLDLTITKTVGGVMGDKTKDFTFNVTGLASDTISNLGTLSYTGSSTVSGVTAPANGTFNSANGLTLTLKHGQAITIKDLPIQTAYKIAENAAVGYDTTCTITNSTTNAGTANTGTFTEADLSVSGKLNFNNAKVDYVNNTNGVPQTGIDTGSINRFIPIAVALLAFIAIVVISLILRHRKRHQLWIG